MFYDDGDDAIDNIDDGADHDEDKEGRCPKLCWSLQLESWWLGFELPVTAHLKENGQCCCPMQRCGDKKTK